MTINLTIPSKETELKATIMVIGVGGAGGNAINNMIRAELDGVSFIAMNTDNQALKLSATSKRIQLGKNETQGLGAGAKPEIGKRAAQESSEEIAEQLQGCHMAFVAAGMGGGTGSGAAPIIAKIAKDMGILTVGVVTKPFTFEGSVRMKVAEEGIKELQAHVDTLIVIPNQNLFRVCNEKIGFSEAFKMVDDVLHAGVRGVTDLITKPSLINLDFADIKSVMSEMGKAQLGTGEVTSEEEKNRAIEAAESAIANPLLEDSSMKGAKSILVNITGGKDMKLLEVDEVVQRIREEIDPDANIIFGAAIDTKMNGSIRVSIVATGMESAQRLEENDPNIHNINDFRKSAETIPGQTSPTSQYPTASADSGITFSADEGEISSHPPTTDELSLPFSGSQQNIDQRTNDDTLEAEDEYKKIKDEMKKNKGSSKVFQLFKKISGIFRSNNDRSRDLKIEPSATKTWPSIKGKNPREELEISLMSENDLETKTMNTDPIPEGPFTSDLETEESTIKATIQETLPQEGTAMKMNHDEATPARSFTSSLKTEEPAAKTAIQETLPEKKPETEVKSVSPISPKPVTSSLKTEEPAAKTAIQETLPEKKPETKVKSVSPISPKPVTAKRESTRKVSKTKRVFSNKQPMLAGIAESPKDLGSDMDEELREIPAFLRGQVN
ncbi:MAG: cell division protein FtsZ [Rickettsiales bacterium]|nr:cell division protein FtsZ [Rickettsiales bacterium]